jgi:hypothetical protein
LPANRLNSGVRATTRNCAAGEPLVQVFGAST